MTSPTQRTLARLKKENYDLVEIVEHYNFFSKKRHDCFSILDIIAIKDKDTYGIQVTSYSNVSARVKKITESVALGPLRKANWTILVEGWHKKDKKWVSRIVDLS